MWNALAVLLSVAAVAAPRSGSVVTNWQPTWSPDGRWIAFASDRDGVFGVWKTDGVHVRRVARNGAAPAWSPDGRRIAFVTAEASTVPSIYVTDASGVSASRRRLAVYAFDPSWAPDGRQIAYTAPSDGESRGVGIWVMRADGSGKRRLVESPDEFTDYVTPAWSPDGKRIAYAIPNSDQGESGIAAIAPGGGNTLSVAASGSEPAWSPDGRRIVFSMPTKGGFGSLFILDLRTNRTRRLTRMLAAGPAWSPGGKRIAFAVRATDGSADIYLINPDGSNLRRLTRTPPSSGPPGTGSDFTDVTNREPDWSPDGRRIAFVTSYLPRVGSAVYAVAVVGVDGRERRTLAPGITPAWSPDGRRLAYAAESPSGANLNLIGADGSDRVRLFHTEQREYPRLEPDWSPDGNRIAFSVLDSDYGVRSIYLISASGGVPQLVVRDGYAPNWSADGSRLLFSSYDPIANRYHLEVVNSDGTGRRRFQSATTPWETPRWSPDGRRIAFSRAVGIHVMNADGSNVRRLADGCCPSWSPDGSSLAYSEVSRLLGTYEILTIPINGGKPTRITYGGCTIVGTDVAETLVGTPRDDVICAFGGNDTVRGGAGDDRILGGNGSDRVDGGTGRDTIFGEDGADTIDGGPGRDSIYGGKGSDAVNASDGERDLVDGGDGTDCGRADARDRQVSVERRSCPLSR